MFVVCISFFCWGCSFFFSLRGHLPNPLRHIPNVTFFLITLPGSVNWPFSFALLAFGTFLYYNSYQFLLYYVSVFPSTLWTFQESKLWVVHWQSLLVPIFVSFHEWCSMLRRYFLYSSVRKYGSFHNDNFSNTFLNFVNHDEIIM